MDEDMDMGTVLVWSLRMKLWVHVTLKPVSAPVNIGCDNDKRPIGRVLEGKVVLSTDLIHHPRLTWGQYSTKRTVNDNTHHRDSYLQEEMTPVDAGNNSTVMTDCTRH